MATELDCRGLACPEPVMRCRSLIAEKRPGSLLVRVDNAAACENVSRFLEKNGYTVSARQESDALWEVTGTVGAACVSAGETARPAPAAAAKTAVLITTEFLGSGDDELGEKLMGNFLATLSDLGDSLWRIILLNGGVKLAVKPGKALDSLKALEASGVSVLVCGTCLSFYGLLESKAVGETTNMLDVVSSLGLADKVVRP